MDIKLNWNKSILPFLASNVVAKLYKLSLLLASSNFFDYFILSCTHLDSYRLISSQMFSFVQFSTHFFSFVVASQLENEGQIGENFPNCILSYLLLFWQNCQISFLSVLGGKLGLRRIFFVCLIVRSSNGRTDGAGSPMRGQSGGPPSSLGHLVHVEADGRSQRGNAHAAQALLRHLRKESFFGEETHSCELPV